MAKQTLDEKINKFVGENLIGKYHLEIDRPDLLKALARLLKEQDRDTRHACAELVIGMGRDTGFTDKKYVDVSEAHAAIINYKRGIK